MVDHSTSPLSREDERFYAGKALDWYGWGSPIGLAIGLVGLAVAAVLVRLAVVGW